MAIDPVARPGQLSGCWARWSEQDQPQFIRTQMENGTVKVRRRTTGVLRRARVSGPIMAPDVPAFLDWFRVLCQGGIAPTYMVEPDGTESVWRFTEPPQVDWSDIHGRFATVSASLEQLPGW